jgi:hypothetical protein
VSDQSRIRGYPLYAKHLPFENLDGDPGLGQYRKSTIF